MNIVTTWLLRRALELGGLFATILTAWAALPPATQGAVLTILQGHWQTVTLGSLAPIAVALFGYAWSFVSTVRPQVVTSTGKQIPIEKHSAAATEIAVIAKAAPKARTILGALLSVFVK